MSLEPKTVTALGLCSGGLDSILAAEMLRRAGVAVELISFETPFFDATQARLAAQRYGFTLHVMDITEPHLVMTQDPPNGRGGHMNPCLDCHAMMFAQAGQLADRLGHQFLFSGEVLFQRPFSQNRGALNRVAKLSGQAHRILRPLSARLLEPTAMERDGLVDRERLGDISGRGRKPQIALAREWGLNWYPTPAGGCLLTDPGFSRRLADLWAHEPGAGPERIRVLRHGRHLRLAPGVKLVVGRNQEDNEALVALASAAGALVLEWMGRPGPLGLYFGPDREEELRLAGRVLASYGKARPGEDVVLGDPGGRQWIIAAGDRQEWRDQLL